MREDDMEWHGPAKAYLKRLGEAEWKSQGCPIPDKYRRERRFCPSQYMRELIECMNRNDQEGFKARKMLEGYASKIGV